MIEVFDGFTPTFNEAMNEFLTQEITERELGAVVRSMAKGKTPGHDGISVEFLQQLWPTLADDFHNVILRGIEQKSFHEGVTRGLISLIPKEGELRNLNYWRPITLLIVIYKIFAKSLQVRLQPLLWDVISLKQTISPPPSHLSWITLS